VSVTRGQDVGVTVTVNRRAAETVACVEQASLTLGLAVVHSLLGRLIVGRQTVRAQRQCAHREQSRSHRGGRVLEVVILATIAAGTRLGKPDWT